MNAIEVKGLTYTYPDGTEALKDINFSVREGECVALVGANGAGKTTLFLCLNGILDGVVGSIKVYGMSPSCSKSVMLIRRKVGIVFQNPDDQIFCPTVFDDVAFGPLNMGWESERVKRCVISALKKVHMFRYQNKLPHHLSSGEKKRVCIAGVLAMQPSTLLLDEPTSDLDPKNRLELAELLKDIGGTQLISTHDFELVFELAERVLVMDNGCIVADGDPKEILFDDKLLQSSGLAETMFLKLLKKSGIKGV